MAYTVPREVLREWAGRDLPATPSPVSHPGPDPAQESGQLSFTPLGVSVQRLEWEIIGLRLEGPPYSQGSRLGDEQCW